MATSRPSKLPKPRYISDPFRYDSNTGTGTNSSNTSNTSTVSSTSSSSNSFREKIRKFFHIPESFSGRSRIPRRSPDHISNGCEHKDKGQHYADNKHSESSDLDHVKVKVRIKVRDKDTQDSKSLISKESKEVKKKICHHLEEKEEEKRRKYRKADVKFVPHRRSKAEKERRLNQKVANCGPADYNFDETISSLRYANRAKNIKNRAKVNEDPKDALLRQFQKEIEDLKKQLEDGGMEDLSGSEYTDDSDGEVGPDGSPKRRKKRKSKTRALSKEKMAEIQSQIDKDRKKLETQKDMEEDEKRKVEEDLETKENELKQAEEEQQQLQHRLSAMEKKIIVGGENLLEKAEEQERLLEESAKELDERKLKADTLRKALEEKEQERLDIEEKYASLEQEVAGKTKKLKKIWTILMSAKSEIADLQQEHQREMEGLLENVRHLSRELRLQLMVIDTFIPPEYQEMIEEYVHWNEDIGEWQLKCVAYTGNNMRKQAPVPDREKDKAKEPDLSHVYLAYTAEGAAEALGQSKPGKKSSRPKTANRPKTSKKKRREPDINSLLS